MPGRPAGRARSNGTSFAAGRYASIKGSSTVHSASVSIQTASSKKQDKAEPDKEFRR